ncbi:hypothetical protein RHGRI_000398 [Rhododendron griersonianum]|uniref:Uncharacterized protein n=1 Tax=Rhododendron griersonianum TaxID=479676 RepID=A0AAV6LGF1_9ERIC|nr:hypothetical protein RHGRI_000398 [Rhododendron griersonianum]
MGGLWLVLWRFLNTKDSPVNDLLRSDVVVDANHGTFPSDADIWFGSLLFWIYASMKTPFWLKFRVFFFYFNDAAEL